MKNALFSNEETKIINFIAKPIISEEDKIEKDFDDKLFVDKLNYKKNLDEVTK